MHHNTLKTCIIALGSNVGDKKFHLSQAKNMLSIFIQDIQESTIIQTKPCYVENQPEFLNQVIMGLTHLDPFTLHTHIKQIEVKIGRTKTYTNGPREIDIDLLYLGEDIISTNSLTVPHPRIQERLFVLEPLNEMAPDWRCPKTGIKVKDMLNEINNKSKNKTLK